MKTLGIRILFILFLITGIQVGNTVFARTALDNTSMNNIKTEQFVGQDFTFLNLPFEKRSGGYEIFPVKDAEQMDYSAPIDFASHVDKEVTVTKTVYIPDQKEYMVYMTVKETGEELAELTRNGQLASLVLSSDLANAKDQFLGKTIYPKFRGLLGFQSNIQIPILIGRPVKVVDVITSSNAQKPISLIVSVDDEKCVLPIAYSWTNIPSANWSTTPAWQESFFLNDPRRTLGWSNSVWENIDKSKVVERMTMDQVQLSWGTPNRVESNNSVWIYGQKKLTFSQDKFQLIETVAYLSSASIRHADTL